MACFLVTAAQAVVVGCAARGMRRGEEKSRSLEPEKNAEGVGQAGNGLSWSARLGILARLLWGGVFLLALEHVWHGEVTPWFPFLTAMGDPGDAAEMLHEMGTVGVTMAVIVTAAWAVMMLVCEAIAKRPGGEAADGAA